MTQRFVPANVPAIENTSQDILHGLDAVPDGFLVVYADADVHATPGREWTREMAYLTAPWRGNAHAIVIFFTLREEPRDA
jgi:hypothetical protein